MRTDIIAQARIHQCELVLANDAVIAQSLQEGAEIQVVPIDQIPDGWLGLDIGPATCQSYSSALKG
jgi:phosphoglycerate kinase